MKALLENNPARCLEIASTLKPGKGPAVHVEVSDDVVVTLTPDACGIAVIRAEALERLDRTPEALTIAEVAAREGCHVAEIVALELRGESGQD